MCLVMTLAYFKALCSCQRAHMAIMFPDPVRSRLQGMRLWACLSQSQFRALQYGSVVILTCLALMIYTTLLTCSVSIWTVCAFFPADNSTARNHDLGRLVVQNQTGTHTHPTERKGVAFCSVVPSLMAQSKGSSFMADSRGDFKRVCDTVPWGNPSLMHLGFWGQTQHGAFRSPAMRVCCTLRLQPLLA